jgi:tetratricopeptide (TPR) repeat protein
LLEPAQAGGAIAAAPEDAEPEAESVEADEAGVADPETPTVDAGEALAAEPGEGEVAVAGEEEAGAEPEAEPEPAEPEPEPETEPTEPEPEPEPEPVPEPIGLGIALGAAAEAALHAGEFAAAHDGLLAAARAHRRAGRLSAAVDACYLAIGLAPSDPDLHLLLAELYLDRGWHAQAVEKLLLLGRLAVLDDDAVVRERLCALVTARLADEPRVAELCA